MTYESKKSFHFAILLILIGALSRLIPHPANFTALTALSLFSGFYLKDIKQASLVLFASLLFSDILIGLHTLIPIVYLALLIPLFCGKMAQHSRYKLPFLIGAGFSSSFAFFIITNFSVWLTSGLYAKSMAGLLLCYTAGIPFFVNQLCGDMIYGTALFGTFYLIKNKVISSPSAQTT